MEILPDFRNRGAECRVRSGAADPGPAVIADLGAEDRALLGELLRAGYRALATKHHPDDGGDAAVMRRLNGLVERLREALAA